MIKIDVVLATYNGIPYLEQQLSSLMSQSYKNFQVLIHDDGSTDGSIEVIKQYQLNYPERIVFIDDEFSSGSAKNNFEYLLRLSKSQYVMFCDQDDFWLDEKVQWAVEHIEKLAKDHLNKPIVCFSDLTVVDENLNVISGSLFKYQKTDPKLATSIRFLSCKNCVTGCTMIINRKAIDLSLPFDRNALMHDWWIALKTLEHKGVVSYMPESFILYRQHSNNQVGARKASFFRFFKLSAFKNFYVKYKFSCKAGNQRGLFGFLLDCIRVNVS